ncbi:MAG: ABC transporter ATP-binding protein [Ruminococcaceae bacterium]|nr:ABC transporter ATP-binding protein [Oscillospiraceae bacterium]
MSDAIISLRNISISFDGESVLENFNLDIENGSFVTLLGPSGCGKTTTLRIIGGFVEPDEGDVFFNGQRINDLPPHKRQLNTIFQRYALFPHLNVFENIAFGMRIQKKSEEEIREKVAEMLRLVSLTGFEKRRVGTLSGGQQQRVAIARAIANDPKVLLLDEPLGALDLKLRKDMQVELKQIQSRLGITFVYVTHDQEEALSMSDVIVVMNHGVIQQIGSPTDIYNEPKNGFVADFIGESNIVDGIMHADCDVEFCGARVPCVDTGFAAGEEVDVVVRPEDVIVVPKDQAQFCGKVLSTTFKGVHYEMRVDIPGQDEDWLIQSTIAQTEGDEIGMRVDPENIHIMKKYTGDYASDIDFDDTPEAEE